MLKLLNVIDEYTREARAIDTERSIDADGVVDCLERLVAERGAPAHVRFDHGPEFIAHAVAEWPLQGQHRHRVHRSGLAVAERLDRVVQRPPARRVLERSALRFPARGSGPPRGPADRLHNRPHSAHGWFTPVEFVEAWLHRQQLTLA